jgi:hypothetical protein
MTKTEMEDAIKNCTGQLAELRGILPTLATKHDIREGLDGLKREMLIRFESVDDEFNMLADAFAQHAVGIQNIQTTVAGHGVKLGTFDVINAAVVDLMSRLEHLISRLEHKGVI